MVRDMARGFVEREVKPVASRLDREGRYPAELVKRLSELGLMGILVPQEFGGSGMDLLACVVAMEEISKAWASLGVVMSVQNSLVCAPILRFGSAAQRQTYLPALARGEWLGCYALTEPGSGSDAGSIQTTANRAGDSFILNGNKIFTTNGNRADLAIVYAVTDPVRGKKGISAFIVETKIPGFIVGKLEDKLGLRSSDTASLIFEDCRVPRENLLGAEGEGFRIALATLDGGRIGIAAQALGIAQGCLEESVAYARERHQFGRAIAQFEAIQWMLADMATEIDAARLLTYRAAWLAEQGRTFTQAAAMAKLFASETANRIAYKAIQIFGGYGYTKEFAVERFFRDARITTLYEGTSEIQRLVIARHLIHGEEIAHEAHGEIF
jgi:alkylation response protein AidB-like acyl-CoA dehydrogenase